MEKKDFCVGTKHAHFSLDSGQGKRKCTTNEKGFFLSSFFPSHHGDL